MAWPILRFQTFGLQNCERIHLSCFKPLSLWPFVPAALGNDSKCAPKDGRPAQGLLPQEMLSPSLGEFARAAGSMAGSATSSWECKHPDGAMAEDSRWRKHLGVLSASLGGQPWRNGLILELDRPWFKPQLHYGLCDSRQTTCPLCASTSSSIKRE